MAWPRRVRLVVLLLAFGAAQCLIVYIYRKVEESRRTIKEPTFRYERLSSTPAPDLEITTPDGAGRKLSELRGKVILLHFWATWCPPCREELPALLDLGRDLSKDGQFEVVAVCLDTKWSAVRAFFGGAIPSEVVRDKQGSAAELYGLSTLPDTYLLASDGSLRLRFSGARDWRTKLARQALIEETTR